MQDNYANYVFRAYAELLWPNVVDVVVMEQPVAVEHFDIVMVIFPTHGCFPLKSRQHRRTDVMNTQLKLGSFGDQLSLGSLLDLPIGQGHRVSFRQRGCSGHMHDSYCACQVPIPSLQRLLHQVTTRLCVCDAHAKRSKSCLTFPIEGAAFVAIWKMPHVTFEPKHFQAACLMLQRSWHVAEDDMDQLSNEEISGWPDLMAHQGAFGFAHLK